MEPRMIRNKCAQCGLVNSAADKNCRRCGSVLNTGETPSVGVEAAPQKKRSLLRRLIWILSTTFLLLLLSFMSQLTTPKERRFSCTSHIIWPARVKKRRSKAHGVISSDLAGRRTSMGKLKFSLIRE